MQNTFTERMRALRAKLDATIDARQAFMRGLRDSVHAMRSNAQSLMAQRQTGHHEASFRMQAGLKEAQERRSEMRGDLRAAAQSFRTRNAARS